MVDPESLAPDVRPKPAPEDFAPPVAWLLGPDLIGALKQFLLYALYKGELDPHDWMEARPLEIAAPAGGELWFDYIADIGDGQRAMYTSALVVQDDLWVENEVVGARGAVPAAMGERPPGWSTLPRGRLLVVGGDTAYPLADTVNLESHVRLPFTWAYRDLVRAGRGGDAPVDLLGIPGNHDYFDLLVGFNRIFRSPVTAEGEAGRRARVPPLGLLGFQRRQTASYFAVRLPWDWQLWGIDPGEHGLDYRQECFFREQPATRKLIACFPTPPVAFGRVIADEVALRDLDALGLPPVFASGRLPVGQARVDLSGDMHYYARFGEHGEYAAIVSGGGGAFHQPSQTDFGEVATQARYPDAATSRRTIADAIFHPFTIINGGVMNIAAFLLTVVVCSGSLWSGTRTLTDWLFGWLGLSEERTIGGGARPLPAPEWQILAGAAIFVASVLVACLLVIFAVRYARWVNRMLRTPRERWSWVMRALRRLPVDRIFEERGYLPSWLLALAGLALPVLTAQVVDVPSGAVLLFQAMFLFVVIGLGVALVPFAIGSGGEYARRGERWVFWVLGLGHWGIQLALPLTVVRIGFGAPLGLGLAALAEGAMVTVAWRLARRGGAAAKWPALVLWLAHGPIVLAILVVCADHALVHPRGGFDATVFVVCAGIVGSVLGCLEYGWYLGVALGWNGHNNEAGAAARLERYREFVRFKLEPDRLTGYVIAIDAPSTEPAGVRPRLVDVFTIVPRKEEP